MESHEEDKMNYSGMSDAQMNALIAKLQYPESSVATPYSHRPDAYIYHRNNTNEARDYCNSWADAGPIIQNNLISLDSVYNFTDETEEFIGPRGMWNCVGISKGEDFCRAEHENPLRAAMIVFLMMHEADNA